MKLNVGNLESFFRIIIGTWIAYSFLHAYIGEWGYVGFYLIATGLSRFSIEKAIFGLNGFDSHSEGAH
jgi:hypothetical protein